MNAPIQSENVNVKIMGRDFAFACAPDEKQSLLECVALVDEKMNAIKALGKLTAIDRIAVMAALTIASDMLALRSASTSTAASASNVRQGNASIETDESLLEIGSVASRMQLTNEAIDRFLDRMRPQLGIKQDELFG